MRRSRALNLLGVLLGVYLLANGPRAEAQTRPLTATLTPAEAAKRLEQWEKKYESVLSDLKAGGRSAAKHARKHAAALLQDVVDRTISGETLTQTAGRTLTLLAIAEARIGDRDAAAWHWQMAQNVFPGLRGLDFGDFPDVAPFMKENLLPERLLQSKGRESAGGPPKEPKNHEPVIPPRIKKKVPPTYPAGLAGHLIGGETVVDAFIDQQGKVRGPVLVGSCGYVSLDLAAMEALREWTYEPAMRDGKPISVFLTVKIDFRLIP